MPNYRGINIHEEVIGKLHPGSTKPAPIKRYSCTVNRIECCGTLDEVKRRIDAVLGPMQTRERTDPPRPHA
jgi:hypothetical protein